MTNLDGVKKLRDETAHELETNILPYWMKHTVDPNGGFYGQINGKGELVPNAVKGGILNARLLWTFASAYRIFKKEEYLTIAKRACREIIDKFYDKKNGGTFWSLDASGKPHETKKQIYQLGFAIYGLSEYSRATGDEESKEYAIKLYHDIESHSFDKEKNGYWEAFTEDWKDLSDLRLSEKDDNTPKTMNTHLHILEAYTCLYRIWKDPELEKQLKNLVNIFCDKILMSSGHLGLFFDENLKNLSPCVSYGHDIEASWLIDESARVLGDQAVLQKTNAAIKKIAEASIEGFLGEGAGMIHEINTKTGEIDASREWWPQCESVIGFFNIYQRFHDPHYLQLAIQSWNFIKNHLIDKEKGEWFWSLYANGKINTDDDKCGFWKCPYHNGRMCMEIYERSHEMKA